MPQQCNCSGAEIAAEVRRNSINLIVSKLCAFLAKRTDRCDIHTKKNHEHVANFFQGNCASVVICNSKSTQ